LDAATKGAVYFSLGALQESEQLAPSILQTLSEVFSELPYTILWRMANTTVVNIPNNVVAKPWFTQQDVLGNHYISLTKFLLFG
jgi:UDP:flavonoid glycosyltransferase YjiC (YdhE family)